MQGEPTQTNTVTSAEEAVEVLLAWQVGEGGIETFPASAETTETEAGWAFFNVNGYLGTVTPAGEVIDEPGMEPTRRHASSSRRSRPPGGAKCRSPPACAST